MLKRNKVISMILAAQLAFNFYSGDVIARADESGTQEKNLSEQKENLDTLGELDQDLQEEVKSEDNVVYENKNLINQEEVSNSDEIDEGLKEEIIEEKNESKEDSKEQIEVKNEDEEEVYYDEAQLINSDKEVIWGEDIDYNWDYKPYTTTCKICTINDVTFTMNDNNTVYISNCNENKSGKLILPSKIKVEGEYYTVTSIEGAFSCCSKLTEVEIPDTITNIGWNSFALCTSLKEIDIPDSVISIGKSAFQKCSYLSRVKLSKNITSIEDGTFSYCNISEIEIPNGVTRIGNGVFLYCSKLRDVTIPDSVTHIDGGAFSNCCNLRDVTIPDSVTILGDYVFSGCEKLSNIKIPSSVASIGFEAFYKTKNLKNIYVDENNEKYCDIDGILFNKDKTELVSYPIGKVENNYSIPNSVTTIKSYAFNYCSNLNAISIPDSVTNLDTYMFEHCSNLNSVWGSNNLKDKLYFGSKDTSLIESNLYNRESYKDDVIKIKADSVKCFEVLSDGNKVEIPIAMNNEGYFVHNPSKSVAGTRKYMYEAMKDGINYTSPIINITVSKEDSIDTWDYNLCAKNNVTYEKTSDNTACVKSCDSTIEGEVVLPSKITVNNVEYDVTEINEDALKGCSGITALNIQVPLTNLNMDLISECAGLVKLVIPSSVTNIDDKVCDLLENITVAEDNTVYSSEDGVLFNKDKSKLIKYPKNKRNTSYVVPDGVKEISANAFKDNKDLSIILIKDNVEVIDKTAFDGCDNLVFSVNSEEMKSKLISIGIEEDRITSYEWDNEDKCVIDGVIYAKNEDDTVSIIGYDKDNLKSKILLLGKMIVGGNVYNVTNINENAFTNCDILQDVKVGDGIQNIGAWAFSACTNLKNVY